MQMVKLIPTLFFIFYFASFRLDGFLRSLENPSHVVLFEKLFRRVLVHLNIENLQSRSTAILCTKCVTRLYTVCRDIIGGFDDMLMIARLLDQTNNMELQQVRMHNHMNCFWITIKYSFS